MIYFHQWHVLHRKSAGCVSDAYYDYRPSLTPLKLIVIMPKLKCQIVTSTRLNYYQRKCTLQVKYGAISHSKVIKLLQNVFSKKK